MKTTDGDSNLKRKLEAWRVEPRVPSSFQREVWQRIAVKETVRQTSFKYQFAVWVSSLLLTPRYAVAVIMAGAFLGIGMAQVEAMNTNAKSSKYLETRYIETVDPYQHISSR
jgi:hypothetical protein